MAVLTLRLVKGTPLTNSEVDNNFSNINSEVSLVSSNIGILSNLTTGTKANLVNAVNEVRSSIASNVTAVANTLPIQATTSGNTVTVSHQSSGVSAAIYGGAGQMPVITFNVTGHATTAANTAVVNSVSNTAPIGASTTNGAVSLTLLNSGVTAGNYGNATNVPAITVDSFGRITAIANVAFSAGGSINVSNEINSSSTYYPALFTVTSGTLATANVSSSKLYYVPNTGTLSATVFNSLSDETQKSNIVTIIDASSTVVKLRGVEFNWNDTGRKSAGVIAQELEKLLPHLVDSGENGIKTVNYSGVIAYLIEAVKELTKRVEVLEGK
jgi:hypothetical protein